MALNLLFLLSSIVTARILDKKKMRVASVAYSVMFIVMLAVLLFTVDVDVIRSMMIQLCGKTCYFNVHFTFVDAIHTPLYGAFIIGALVLTFVVQLAATVFCVAKEIVYHFSKQNSRYQKAKKARPVFVHSVHDLFLSPNINLLYCRMLN